jgi:hypothetical protein
VLYASQDAEFAQKARAELQKLNGVVADLRADKPDRPHNGERSRQNGHDNQSRGPQAESPHEQGSQSNSTPPPVSAENQQHSPAPDQHRQ